MDVKDFKFSKPLNTLSESYNSLEFEEQSESMTSLSTTVNNV